MISNMNLPMSLAVWLATDNYQYAKNARTISATTLLKSPRNIIGSIRERYPEAFDSMVQTGINNNVNSTDLLSKVAVRIGTAIHDSIEKSWVQDYRKALAIVGYPQDVIDRICINPEVAEPENINIYLEQRLFKEIDIDGTIYTISGQFDMVINGELNDHKTTSAYSIENKLNDYKYMMQGSIYRYLNPKLITSDYIQLGYIVKDFEPYKVSELTNYPKAQIFGQKLKLMSINDIEAYIINKLRIVNKYWDSPLLTIPCCTDQELYGSRKSVFKYYKNGFVDGARSTKNFDTMLEASNYRSFKGKSCGDIIEVKPKAYYCPYCDESLIPETPKKLLLNKPNQIIIG